LRFLRSTRRITVSTLQALFLAADRFARTLGKYAHKNPTERIGETPIEVIANPMPFAGVM
jgi:hypothetical protein